MRTPNHTDHTRPSATIYQFPVGGRAALGARRGEIKPIDFQGNYPAVDFGAAWYHDDAIEDAKRPH